MKKHQKSVQNGTTSIKSRLFFRRKNSLSTAKLCGYNGRAFEETMKAFWKDVAGFSCEWCEGWDEGFVPDCPLSEKEKAVTFIMSIKTETEGEIEKGRLYMVYDIAANTLSAVGFVDQNDGYKQIFTAQEIESALKTVFDEHN